MAGTINSVKKVDTNIPPTTATPMAIRPWAPSPVAYTNGTRPRMVDTLVIKIGRRRTFAALRAAEVRLMPDKRRWVAYSVYKMAVFANNPINMIRPVCR